MNDKMLTVNDVAEYLGVPKATLYAWSTRGLGPRRYRVGKHLRHRRTDVDAWLETQAQEAARW
ncbi:transcriptional regulator, AlpA family [Geodermatophilus africanus]|uniref:Transcriptional regulator, AlpA family n=1 Tax=Geodermatophilus africanus TaxID=1137993 RepID=A0A1H3G4F0_9ACTN|nr:helix-turn-helix domain-containing protein [Geodermatophilus africanus]SDX98126.1 transcriptional regulator, AlpA family [Geodermatophilus africanus]